MHIEIIPHLSDFISPLERATATLSQPVSGIVTSLSISYIGLFASAWNP